MKKALILSLSIILFSNSFAQSRKFHASFDTSKIVGFICTDSSCNSITSFKGYVIMYDPSDKELDGYRDGSKIKIKKMPEEIILDESKHKLLYKILIWYFVEWK